MILFVGPKNAPVTGQSLAFDIISKEYDGVKTIFRYGGSSSFAVLCSSLLLLFRYLLNAILSKQKQRKVLYLTTSRSRLGFLRDFLLITISSKFGIRVVNHLHGADFFDFRQQSSKCLKRMVDIAYSKVDISIVLSEGMKEQYSDYPCMEVQCVSNAADYKGDPSYAFAGSLKVLYLSNLIYSKGIEYVVNAIDDLHKQGVDVELTVVGQPMGDDYRSKSEMELYVKNNIIGKSYIDYKGVLQGREKYDVLSASNVFVLPTFYKTEAQPISIIEAMMSGNVIITTEHNYIRDFISEDNGFLIPVKSSKHIVECLKECFYTPGLVNEISQSNANYAKREYSLDNHVKQLSLILNEVKNKESEK